MALITNVLIEDIWITDLERKISYFCRNLDVRQAFDIMLIIVLSHLIETKYIHYYAINDTDEESW